jgi:single-strand DNA-binding protein
MRRLSMSVNKVILVGRLGTDPELRFTSEGKALCNFPIATTEKWSSEDGKKNEKTQWHRVVCWGQLAENCDRYLKKGREVYLEGRIQTRSYEDKDGSVKYFSEIIALSVVFLGTNNKDEPQEGDAA